MAAERNHPAVPKPAGSTWTDEQWEAIVTGGQDVLVAAAAGSGKTAVLVERIIRRISSDTDVDRLLVATFTKAAAAEMKERIRIALERALERDPGSEHLRRQLALMNRAAITTLHSFCLDVIRRYYPLIGLDPGFRVANETEAELLRAEVLDDLFEELYASDEADAFMTLAETFGGERGDEPLAQLVHTLYDFSMSHPWPEHWLELSADAFRVGSAQELEDSEWVRMLHRDIRLTLEGARSQLEQALDVTRLPGGPDAYAETLLDDLRVVGGLLETVSQQPWSAWFEPFRSAAFGKLKAQRGGDADKTLQERAKALREGAKAAVSGLTDELFRRSPDDYAAELAALAPLMARLSQLVAAFGRRYEAAKRAKGLVDFGDLEHYCLRILRDPSSTPARTVPSAAALDYRAQFDEILLDEYQDTNMVQEAIVDLIARDGAGNRFMVGDVKQSIYRFRLAEPGLFLAKYKAFGAAQRAQDEAADSIAANRSNEPDGSQAPGRRIDLARNFRSRPEVVDGVNDVFRGIMHETVAEMDYDRSAELVFGAPYPPADPDLDGADRYAVECVLIDRGAPETGEGAGGDQDAQEMTEGEGGAVSAAEAAADMQTAELEARWIARRIRAMMDGEDGKPLRVYDVKRGVHRPAQWRDFVILLRAPGAWAQIMTDELRAAGIPAYAELRDGYFEATEVETMLSLLRVIDNPYQDIPLAGTLRSPIVGLSAEELAAVRIASGRGAYYDAVVRAASHDAVPEPLRRKLSGFLERLEGWREAARQGSLTDLLWRIYRESGYYDLAGGLPGGVQRQANLRALHDRARQYEATSFRGLFRFLRFIERMRDSGGDLGAAKALGEQEDVVRIMSIHASKGLEFPVVFVAGLGKKFNLQDMNGQFLLHKQLGFGPRMVEAERRVAYPTIPHLAIKRRMLMETLAEEMRVLYVAMTRPKEKMILLGTAADGSKAMERWRQAIDAGTRRLPDHRLAAARSFLDWIMPLAAASAEDETAERLELGEDGGTALVRGWRLGVAPAVLLGAEAAPAAEPDESAEAERQAIIQKIAALEPIPSAGAYAEVVDERLSWHYPHEAAVGIAAKTSVTEMKRLLAEGQEDALPLAGTESAASAEAGGQSFTFRLRRPRFLEEKKLTAAERGTINHLVMQHIPLDRPHDEQAVRELLEGMKAKAMLTAAQAETVDAASIAAFFVSELGSRLLAARWVKREVPFSRTVPAERVHPQAAADPAAAAEPVLIQGVIDCLFEDEHGLVLLDYKTDRIIREDWEAAAERHRFQLELYAESVGAILGRPVAEAHVFFLEGAQSVRLV